MMSLVSAHPVRVSSLTIRAGVLGTVRNRVRGIEVGATFGECASLSKCEYTMAQGLHKTLSEREEARAKRGASSGSGDSGPNAKPEKVVESMSSEATAEKTAETSEDGPEGTDANTKD